jgi:hypothetical protein
MPVTFRLVSEFQTLHRRPFALADPTILRPATSANPLIMGEWLDLTTAYKMQRGTGDLSVPSWPYFAEEGRYEVQAIDKGPFLYMGSFEAETMVFDGAAISAVGQRLYVGDVTYASLTRKGLKGIATPTTEVSIGFVTRLPADNGGWLRFIRDNV